MHPGSKEKIFQALATLDFMRILCQPLPVGISLQQFDMLKQRLGSPRRPAAIDLQSRPARDASRRQVVLGIDPSLRSTGYGIIRMAAPFPETLAQEAIRCPASWEPSRCLVKIMETLREAIRAHQPKVCVLEGLFYAQNIRTALILGQARGAAMVAAAEAGLEIHEIAPRKVKQAIVGYGAAQKLAVARMVQRLLNLPAPPGPDAADALALALTHARGQSGYALNLPKRL